MKVLRWKNVQTMVSEGTKGGGPNKSKIVGVGAGTFTAATVAAANALLSTLASAGCAGSQAATASFQTAYMADPAASFSIAPIDGRYDDTTRGALAEALGKATLSASSVTIDPSIPAACPIPGTPTPATPTTTSTTNVTATTTTTPAASSTPLIVGFALAAVGVGAYFMMSKDSHRQHNPIRSGWFTLFWVDGEFAGSHGPFASKSEAQRSKRDSMRAVPAYSKAYIGRFRNKSLANIYGRSVSR